MLKGNLHRLTQTGNNNLTVHIIKFIHYCSNPLFRVNSVCRCCCWDKDGCNKQDDFCLTNQKCPPLEERYGLKIDCSNERELNSTCHFSCIGSNQRLSGSSINKCNLKGPIAAWNERQPTCERKWLSLPQSISILYFS